MRDHGDREATRVMLAELRRLETWLSRAEGYGKDYGEACDRAIELRNRLGLSPYAS